MRLFHTCLKIIWLISLILWVILKIYHPPLPSLANIQDNLTTREPIQTPVNPPPFTQTAKNFTYTITPLFAYEQWGLVVQQYLSNSWYDIYHKNDPANTRDLCLVWGNNLSHESYNKVQFSHGQFTCYYRYNQPPDPPFDPTKFANNHLLPATDAISRKINQVKIGDQIHLTGYLVNYTVTNSRGETIGSRQTSTTRTDTKGGACEVLYVTGLDIIQKGNPVYDFLYQASSLTALISTLLLIVFFFLPLP